MSDTASVASSPPAPRELTPEQKLHAALRLYWSARELKAAAIRAEHPDWSETEIAAAVRTAFLLHRE